MVLFKKNGFTIVGYGQGVYHGAGYGYDAAANGNGYGAPAIGKFSITHCVTKQRYTHMQEAYLIGYKS